MFANVFLCLCTEEDMFGIILIFLFDFLMNGKFNWFTWLNFEFNSIERKKSIRQWSSRNINKNERKEKPTAVEQNWVLKEEHCYRKASTECVISV